MLVADAGKESQCAAIAKDVHGAWAEMPEGSPSNFDLNDWHQEKGLAAVFGPSGSGKSFLVLDLLTAVASGADWFGNRTKAAPVLYAA